MKKSVALIKDTKENNPLTKDGMNFLGFLGIEEHNLLVCFTKYGREIQYIAELDKLFIRLLELAIPKKYRIILLLFMQVRHQLYSSNSVLFRSHLSEALIATRIAIDAAFTAYVLFHEPELEDKYKENKDPFRNIKKYISEDLENKKRKIIKYPLASGLVGLHGKLSQFAHADLLGFVYRYDEAELDDLKSVLEYKFFQIPENEKEIKFYIYVIFTVFAKCLEIFEAIFKSFSEIDPKWSDDRSKFEREFLYQVKLNNFSDQKDIIIPTPQELQKFTKIG